LDVSQDVISALVDAAAAVYPRECCGILFGSVGNIEAIRPATNVHPTPHSHFEIDPQTLIDAHRAARKGGPQPVGYYHSHPNGLAEPSSTDRAMAAGDGSIWAIIAAGRVTFWRSGDAGFAPLPYVTCPR
jgi:proteasome lid subunit RPN8/RPN11